MSDFKKVNSQYALTLVMAIELRQIAADVIAGTAADDQPLLALFPGVKQAVQANPQVAELRLSCAGDTTISSADAFLRGDVRMVCDPGKYREFLTGSNASDLLEVFVASAGDDGYTAVQVCRGYSPWTYTVGVDLPVPTPGAAAYRGYLDRKTGLSVSFPRVAGNPTRQREFIQRYERIKTQFSKEIERD